MGKHWWSKRGKKPGEEDPPHDEDDEARREDEWDVDVVHQDKQPARRRVNVNTTNVKL